jgi:hypothetical protein
MTVKRRDYNEVVPLDPPGGSYRFVGYYRDTSITQSHRKLKNGNWANGGQWDYTYDHFVNTPVKPGPIRLNVGGTYNGSFVVGQDSGATISDLSPSTFGASAYSRMKPTAPSFQTLNAVYELREIPGMLKQRFTKDLLGVPNYWLALQFGWRPLLNDIINFVITQRTAQKRLAQLMRDNGKPVRRRTVLYDYTDSSTSSETSYGATYPIMVTQAYRSIPTMTTKVSYLQRAWASARFRYWLPDGPRDVNWTNAMLARIYGLYPTPSVVYNAIPWTWLVDWFSNVGDVIDNLDGGVANRLAADYFYVMTHTEALVERITTAQMWSPSGGHVDFTCQFRRAFGAKRRGVGDPFGFATNAGSLSSMQLSIMGALGLSRLR